MNVCPRLSPRQLVRLTNELGSCKYGSLREHLPLSGIINTWDNTRQQQGRRRRRQLPEESGKTPINTRLLYWTNIKLVYSYYFIQFPQEFSSEERLTCLMRHANPFSSNICRHFFIQFAWSTKYIFKDSDFAVLSAGLIETFSFLLPLIEWAVPDPSSALM